MGFVQLIRLINEAFVKSLLTAARLIATHQQDRNLQRNKEI
jgi:hypothetical protein